MKTLPVLPTNVTQPTNPSVLTFAFMRMRPDFCSFSGNTRSSRTSPTLSFLVGKSGLLAAMSRDSVMVISFITLKKRPPSLQSTEPSLCVAVAHPVEPSFKARTSTRVAPAVSSLMGPCSTSTTSFASSFLTSLPSAMHLSSVRATSSTTFMYKRLKSRNRSLVTVVASSSQRWPKSLDTSSAEITMVSSLGSTSFEENFNIGIGSCCVGCAGWTPGVNTVDIIFVFLSASFSCCSITLSKCCCATTWAFSISFSMAAF
mmetsp:Transcript_33668/g.76217  ORF Transcript_33668/g.76217 Transcript_33668/m.76217 type:complete len:259 (-) Transcript_33668:821-1597(-)